MGPFGRVGGVWGRVDAPGFVMVGIASSLALLAMTTEGRFGAGAGTACRAPTVRVNRWRFAWRLFDAEGYCGGFAGLVYAE